MAPIRARSAEEALEQLRARVAAFDGARSLMRVRATANGRTQSFRAQLVIPDRNSMELIAYTPVGTTAATIRATGDQISFVNHLENSAWEGTPEDLARSLSIYASSILPAEMAMVMIGLPAAGSATYATTPSGLLSAAVDEVVVTFHPPQFPARGVTIRRGSDVVTIEHLEIVSGQ
ncbi:MAG TPA: hypothetical protein VM779_16390 [Thermoanaerobaculia bacterium]|nr:hypothetical protein [Thermoanaerobaculia bacterium]